MQPVKIKDIVAAVNGKLLCGDPEEAVTSVSTNSKEINQGTLFVPIIGERVDAHKFITMALDAGAVAAFTSEHTENSSDLNKNKAYIQVENTLTALQQFGAYYRSLFPIPVIGITGSVGKTTTKEMIAAALATEKNVLKTAGNMNSQIGLPLMMFQIEPEHDIAVIEMGISERGEMQRLCNIARPEIAVMTNIGVSHIGQLGSRENIRKEKLNIINHFGEKEQFEARLYINGEDDMLSSLLQEDKETVDMDQPTKDAMKKTKVVSFGQENTNAYYAENVQTVGEETHFIYISKSGKEDVILSVLGIHNVNNAVVALAVAEQFGIAPNAAKKGLKAYQPIAMRGQVYERDGVKIIDDTYNASPDSMKSGIHVLLEMQGITRRITLLADVLELGDVSQKCHYEVGSYIAALEKEGKKIDTVFTVGTEAAFIADAVRTEGKDIFTKSFSSNEEAVSYLKSYLKEGDAIMLKGSRGMHIDEIVEALK